MNPDISVVIPSHNEGPLLLEAVSSVLDQIKQKDASPRIEIIVVDDRSKAPETLEILDTLPQLSPDVFVFTNPGTPGSAATRNFGISKARSTWIAFLDADDLWTAGSLHDRWNAICSHSKAEWIASDYLILNKIGQLEETPAHAARPAVQELLLTGLPLPNGWHLRRPAREFIQLTLAWTGSVMCTKALLLRAGGFNEDLLNAQDVHLWTKLATLTDFYYIRHPWAIYRIRPGSQTNSGKPPAQWGIKAFQALLSDPEMAEWKSLIHKRLAHMARSDAHFMRSRGRPMDALSSAGLAVKYDPTNFKSWREVAKTPLALFHGRVD